MPVNSSDPNAHVEDSPRGRADGMPFRKRVPLGRPAGPVEGILRHQKLRTVCEDARCPNRHECYSAGTATFIILGDVCTRNCPYCSIPQGRPKPPDEDEPLRLAQAVAQMQLRHVVITSVNRDDLPTGGAEFFARCIAEVRRLVPTATLEVLTPDYLGKLDALQIVLDARPEVYNHNIETVPRLFKPVRPGGKYQRSLDILARAAEVMREQHAERANNRAAGNPDDRPTIESVKSGLMVGLGETREEISAVLRDLRAVGVTCVTVGQYLKSDADGLAVEKYYEMAEYAEIRKEARALGFAQAFCGPFVRSSYHAGEVFHGTDPTAAQTPAEAGAVPALGEAE